MLVVGWQNDKLKKKNSIDFGGTDLNQWFRFCYVWQTSE
jgi:hypothetical protein